MNEEQIFLRDLIRYGEHGNDELPSCYETEVEFTAKDLRKSRLKAKVFPRYNPFSIERSKHHD